MPARGRVRRRRRRRSPSRGVDGGGAHAARHPRPFRYDDSGPYPFEAEAAAGDDKLAHDLYVWNGRQSLALTKAVALTKCFELERALINDTSGAIRHLHAGHGGGTASIDAAFRPDYAPPPPQAGEATQPNHLLALLSEHTDADAIECASLLTADALLVGAPPLDAPSRRCTGLPPSPPAAAAPDPEPEPEPTPRGDAGDDDAEAEARRRRAGARRRAPPAVPARTRRRRARRARLASAAAAARRRARRCPSYRSAAAAAAAAARRRGRRCRRWRCRS